jgi:hypothetical protein
MKPRKHQKQTKKNKQNKQVKNKQRKKERKKEMKKKFLTKRKPTNPREILKLTRRIGKSTNSMNFEKSLL